MIYVRLNPHWDRWEARDENGHLIYRAIFRGYTGWLAVMALVDNPRAETDEFVGWPRDSP